MAKKEKADFFPIDFILNRTRNIISISPALDLVLGGGLVSGTWSIFVGAEKAGKTTTILHACAKAQRPENGSRNVYYANVEGRLKRRDIESIPGLDLTKFFVIGSTPAEKNEKGEITKPAEILSAEEFLSRSERVLKDDPGCVLVIDSESMLVGQDELDEGMEKMFRADGAKLMAKFARKVSNLISTNDNIVITVRHLMANPTGYGSPISEKGSKAGSYATDCKLIVKKADKWLVGEKNVGKILNWEVGCGYLPGAIPGTTISSYLRYGMGIDEEAELVQMGIDLGVISQAGAWYSFKANKYQGQENFVKAVRSDHTLKAEVLTEIKTLVC